MAESKLDLPDDLLSSKPSDHSWTSRVEAPRKSDEDKVIVGSNEESKDQLISESSIPLSPQWLYNKPSESKDARAPTSASLGSPIDPNQKEGWRLDASEDKKDWRRIATESESSRRWREEERETGLLVARRDRRKTDRRVDIVPIRETMDGRNLPSSDRWHDGGSRNSGHEARRDSKWSSRWGPDDKDKESRAEKRTDVEKDDAHNDNHSSIGGKSLASERDSDSRDKWRPRHRMEAHSAGSTSHRAAPGFGLERGRADGSSLGFSAGRGRASAIGRSSSAGTIHLFKSGNVIGKPNLITDSFCYPRGKLLDIYRSQKLDPSFATMSSEMEESLPITQVSCIEPLAFVAPDTEEEAILTDIWKGKITSSGVIYNSFRKGRSAENFSGVGDVESVDGKQAILPPLLAEETSGAFEEAANNDAYQTDGYSLWDQNSSLNELHGKEVNKSTENKVTDDEFAGKVLKSDGDIFSTKESGTAFYAASKLRMDEDWEMANSAITQHFNSNDTESAASVDVKSKLPEDSSSLFVHSSPEQNQHSSALHLESNREEKAPASDVPLEDLYFFYIDPNGKTQGPFLGADIIMWFDEGYFGTELPVRLAEAPKDAPFQSLGEVMPHLKQRGGYSASELEQSGAFVGKLDSSLPVASVPEITESSTVNESYQSLLESNILSAQHAQSRMSEPEAPLQLAHSQAQIFNDPAAQDEEIVFPGRSSNSGHPAVKSSGNFRDPITNSSSHPSLPIELTEAGVPYQNDNKLHPFGLLWSELEGSHARHSESSNMPSSVGKAAPFGSMAGPAPVADKWTDVYRQDTVSGPNSFQDTIGARHLSRIEQEPNHFDLAEQFMSRQFQQQQFPQQNLMSHHAQLNESFLEHVPTHNLIHHQQLANHPAPDLEHLLALQLQQQRQRQLQLQQHQLQQQQFHQQKLLQERQNALIEQLRHGRMPDPNHPQSHVDPIRANSVIDQVLLEQQLMHDLQQRPHQPSRHFVPSVEQLTQAKYAQVPHQEQQRDLLELLLRAQHGQIQSLEDQILQQEQLQARQLSMGLRQRANMEDEMHVDSSWPVNDNNQFLRSLASSHRAQTSGVSALDFYQRQQRPPVEEQLSQLERNLSFQDRLLQGLYEPGSVPFERSLSLPAGASGMNIDVLNAMARAQGLDTQELNGRMQSAGHAGSFSSGIHPQNQHNSVVPNQFRVSHLNTIEGHWPESNEQIANDWMESRIKQLHINAERPKRESEVSMTGQDPSFWMSDGMNDEKPRRLLMELLHQKSGNQPAESINMNDGMPFEKRALSGLYSGLSSSDHAFSVVPDRESGLNSIAVGSYGSNGSLEICSTNDQANNLENMLSVSETGQAVIADSSIIDKPYTKKEYLQAEGKKHGSKIQGIMKGSVSEMIPVDTQEQARLVAADCGETPTSAHSRHSSLGVGGFYEGKAGPQNLINQVPLASKGQENILLRRPPVSRTSSSQEGLPELVSDTVIKGKCSMSSADGGNQSTDMSSAKKEVHFRRTSSCSDADVSEPSFIDMLKSNTKKTTTPDVPMMGVSESGDGAQGGRSGKKKGKKGRQIDPSLLGFRVTSNRIMMGEIQRPED